MNSHCRAFLRFDCKVGLFEILLQSDVFNLVHRYKSLEVRELKMPQCASKEVAVTVKHCLGRDYVKECISVSICMAHPVASMKTSYKQMDLCE